MKKKILVVEDNPQNQKLFRDLLEVSGFDVLEAQDGKTGISMAKEHKPDLVIMDFQMPEMNGLQAGKILREDSETKEIPCIFVTASVTKEEIAVLEGNGYYVIAKPINTRTFVSEITKHIKD